MNANWKIHSFIRRSSRRHEYRAFLPLGSLSGTKRLHESDTFGLDKEIVKKFL